MIKIGAKAYTLVSGKPRLDILRNLDIEVEKLVVLALAGARKPRD